MQRPSRGRRVIINQNAGAQLPLAKETKADADEHRAITL